MNSKILLFASLAILATVRLEAQMNVGSAATADASAMLQVSGTSHGFLLPVLTTAQRTAITNPAAGLMIFNSTTNQMEVNTGTTTSPVWTATTGSSTVISTQPVDISTLGYIPSFSATATAAVASFSFTNAGITSTYTKNGTFTSPINNHSFAVYKQTAGSVPTWFGAYFAAKSLGGYLGTFTSLAEWNSVYSNLLSVVANNINYSIWFGMAKMSWRSTGTGAQADVIDWITGEHSALDYSGGASNIWIYQNFISGEPNNTGSVEGFMQSVNSGTGQYSTGNTSSVGTLFGWNDVTAASTTSPGFIVEFNQ